MNKPEARGARPWIIRLVRQPIRFVFLFGVIGWGGGVWVFWCFADFVWNRKALIPADHPVVLGELIQALIHRLGYSMAGGVLFGLLMWLPLRFLIRFPDSDSPSR